MTLTLATNRPTVLTCAVTGNLTMREQNPALPVTPAEIASSGVDAWRAGAAVLHLHARDPATGRGTTKAELFDEIVARIRDAGCDAILNLSTGEGGRFSPSDDDPKVAAPGSTLMRPELRIAHVERLRPEICTLDFNTMYSGASVVINTPRNLEIMANRALAAGVVPEIEIFDGGDLQLALAFVERGILKGPLMWQIVLGVRYGAMADPQTMMYLASRLPAGAQWTAFGIDISDYRVIVAKGVHAPVTAYQEICKRFVRVNTPGVTTADMTALTYLRRRRPLYPFEDGFDWSPAAEGQSTP